ncbi:MAG TPA: CheR family methyltransferase [Gemmataceae bacterium]|nr:CheR family methyltransferase [Gemmataceae bacterium]
MNLARVIDLLRQRIGLEPDSLGATTLPRAVTARMRALGLTAPEAYATRLAGDAEEFQILLADVAVPETWFFRGGEVFTYLAGHVGDAVRQQGSGKRFRILSVPCSTGEEPYSLAIALTEAGVLPASWEIEALDLSFGHVKTARQARFGKFSFRQTTPALRDRYFKPVESCWELDPRIRSRVRFRQGNLLDPQFLVNEESFDLILCRNLFIYLHPDARQQALNTIIRLLAADGWLCVGHADRLDIHNACLTRAGPESYFLYRRAALPASPAPTVSKTLAPPNLDHTVPESALAAAEGSSPVALLEHARQQADSGKLADALASCQEQLARVGPSADLYSLMGVIHQAQQEQDAAVRCYQRALYLDRDHPEALAHLMLLSQERGDGVQAERLRRRLKRVTPGGDT